MHVACYARKGRKNQLVIEFSDEEYAKTRGLRYDITVYEDEVTFIPTEEGGRLLTKRMSVPTDNAPFGKTESLVNFEGSNWFDIEIPEQPNKLRKRRPKPPSFWRRIWNRLAA